MDFTPLDFSAIYYTHNAASDIETELNNIDLDIETEDDLTKQNNTISKQISNAASLTRDIGVETRSVFHSDFEQKISNYIFCIENKVFGEEPDIFPFESWFDMARTIECETVYIPNLKELLKCCKKDSDWLFTSTQIKIIECLNAHLFKSNNHDFEILLNEANTENKENVELYMLREKYNQSFDEIEKISMSNSQKFLINKNLNLLKLSKEYNKNVINIFKNNEEKYFIYNKEKENSCFIKTEKYKSELHLNRDFIELLLDQKILSSKGLESLKNNLTNISYAMDFRNESTEYLDKLILFKKALEELPQKEPGLKVNKI